MKMAKKDFLTATDLYRYLQCPHWPYWERFGDRKRDRRRLTETEEQRMAEGLDHEKTIVKKLFGASKTVRITSPQAGFKQTLALMKEGAPLIYQGWLIDGDWAGRPDILERREGKSAFGNWYYVPVDVKRAHELKKEHKAQLAFYCLLLERMQGRFPGEPCIVNGDGERLSFSASNFITELKALIETVESIRRREKPEPVYRKACEDTSPWGKACRRLAEERHDIALLFNVNVKTLKSLRDCGVRTIEDASALDPPDLEGQAPGLTLRVLTHVRRQAQSLRDQTVIVKEPFLDETRGLEIHFDIESHLPTDTDYLYGFWIRDKRDDDPSGRAYRAFVSKKPSDESKMWREFLAWLPTLPSDYTVYHYANYEPTRLTILAKRYGDEQNPDLQKFHSRLLDLKEVTRECVVFPVYFYSLKMICKYLGFSWSGEVKNGAQSITEYDKWLKTKRRKILDAIVQYNQDDVKATAFLLDWLRAYAKQSQEYRRPYPWEV